MTIDKGSKGSRARSGAGPGAAVSAGTTAPAGPAGSPIAFRLEPGSGVPTYLQLVHQVEQALRLGHLTEGDRLPTVKETVSSLAINPNTVLKAYRELEHRALAEGKPGQGTFICGTLHRAGLAEQEALRLGLLGWLRSADEAGLDQDGMTALFSATMRDFLDPRDARQPGRVA
jgi:GntR family transcriptional regulator